MKRMDAAKILEELAKLRAGLPPEMRDRRSPRKEGATTRMKLPSSGDAMADFEEAAVIEALESLADDVGAVVQEKRAKLLAQALEIYYTAEELARNPEHANLIPHVEEMRRAYEKEYGKPIPPKKAK